MQTHCTLHLPGPRTTLHDQLKLMGDDLCGLRVETTAGWRRLNSGLLPPGRVGVERLVSDNEREHHQAAIADVVDRLQSITLSHLSPRLHY